MLAPYLPPETLCAEYLYVMGWDSLGRMLRVFAPEKVML